jgi:UDP-glucose 4-epimerase
MKKLILVTGGTGYIGSHTAVELIKKDYEVIIVDNLANSKIETLNSIEKITGIKPKFEKLDLCDNDALNHFFTKYPDISAIIHFAAYKAVGESVENPLKYYENNILSLINIIKGMRKYDIPNMVFSSSCTVYGQPDVLPVTESAPIQKAESPYGNTKQINEEILEDYLKVNKDLRCISLRYFNPIGAHPSGLIGELPIGMPSNLVPLITQTAAGVILQLKVFGNDYDTPDGTAIRDFIDVVDLSKAHVIAIERLLSNKQKSNFEIFNLGTGRGISVLELITEFEKVTGIKINYKIVERRQGDIEKVWADTKLANEELGWKSETPLQETLRSAWNWEKYYRSLK